MHFNTINHELDRMNKIEQNTRNPHALEASMSRYTEDDETEFLDSPQSNHYAPFTAFGYHGGEYRLSSPNGSVESNSKINNNNNNNHNHNGADEIHELKQAERPEDTKKVDIEETKHPLAGASLPLNTVPPCAPQVSPMTLNPAQAIRYSGEQGAAAKRHLLRKVQHDVLRKLAISTEAILVHSPTKPYYVYHLLISNDYYQQKWVVAKRYSEFYRFRQRLLQRMQDSLRKGKGNAHHGCPDCTYVYHQLKEFDFPKRFVMFSDENQIVAKRIGMLEEFVIALCQFLSSSNSDVSECHIIGNLQVYTKKFLQFPMEYELQHLRAVRNLTYVDPRDVRIETDSCPICLSDWRELDGNLLVESECGHYFHEHCINEWFQTRFDCPMCRVINGTK